ncbi:hypothetical protein [Bacillus sp. V2I10]|uniref:hypothetical protein n=1 Tax=Bacillus sp. V2I10 TaxID=3042276 RepID=UPI0027846C99|nr:hypothetical protein [Bacillus sp. V2I10]MDQ0860636.1 hypothetical protein [Bacillus sp. V2I10]
MLEMTGEEQLRLLLLLHGLIALYTGFAIKGIIQKYIGLIVYIIGLLASSTKMIYAVWSYESVVWMCIVASLIIVKLLLRKFSDQLRKVMSGFWTGSCLLYLR